MRNYCGMDFGTSNSVITLLTEDDGRLSFRSIREPSLIFFPEAAETTAERYCGVEAMQRYVESGMKGRFFQSVKTLLPDTGFRHTRVNGKAFSVEDLVAVVLRDLRERLSEQTGVAVQRAAFGRPARFSDRPEDDEAAEARLKAAAEQAGFTGIRFCPEPVAGAHAYGNTAHAPATVFVADHGGGTSDFTVMRLAFPSGASEPTAGDALATTGVRVGGDDLDADIMWHRLVDHFGHGSEYESWGKMLPVPVHIFRTITRWDRIHFLKTTKYREELRYFRRGATDPDAIERLIALVERDEGFFLSRAVEAGKIALSDRDRTRVTMERLNIDEEITRRQFESYIRNDLEAVDRAVAEALEQAGVGPRAVDAVFMTGGTSRVPAVRAVMARRFGAERIVEDSDELESVSRGLALAARRLGLTATLNSR